MFSIFRCVAHGTNRGLHLIRISMEFLLYALLNLLSIKHNNGMPRRCSGHMKLISTEMHVMFIKLSNTFMINKYVRLVYFSKANNDVLTNVKHFFDESVGLARSNTFFFLRVLVLNNKNARRIPAHWPSALGLIFESRVYMGCYKDVPCLLH